MDCKITNHGKVNMVLYIADIIYGTLVPSPCITITDINR